MYARLILFEMPPGQRDLVEDVAERWSAGVATLPVFVNAWFIIDDHAGEYGLYSLGQTRWTARRPVPSRDTLHWEAGRFPMAAELSSAEFRDKTARRKPMRRPELLSRTPRLPRGTYRSGSPCRAGRWNGRNANGHNPGVGEHSRTPLGRPDNRDLGKPRLNCLRVPPFR